MFLERKKKVSEILFSKSWSGGVFMQSIARFWVRVCRLNDLTSQKWFEEAELSLIAFSLLPIAHDLSTGIAVPCICDWQALKLSWETTLRMCGLYTAQSLFSACEESNSKLHWWTLNYKSDLIVIWTNRLLCTCIIGYLSYHHSYFEWLVSWYMYWGWKFGLSSRLIDFISSPKCKIVMNVSKTWYTIEILLLRL